VVNVTFCQPELDLDIAAFVPSQSIKRELKDRYVERIIGPAGC
jgi:hypothetical protein